jgi:hypothetical protein
MNPKWRQQTEQQWLAVNFRKVCVVTQLAMEIFFAAELLSKAEFPALLSICSERLEIDQ